MPAYNVWTDDQARALQWAEALGFELQRSPSLSAMGIDHWVIRAAGESRGSDSITVARGLPMDFVPGGRSSADVRAMAAAFGLRVI